jgi:hypothetical protein
MEKKGINSVGFLILILGVCTMLLGLQGYSPTGTTENEQPMCGEYWCK